MLQIAWEFVYFAYNYAFIINGGRSDGHFRFFGCRSEACSRCFCSIPAPYHPRTGSVRGYLSMEKAWSRGIAEVSRLRRE